MRSISSSKEMPFLYRLLAFSKQARSLSARKHGRGVDRSRCWLLRAIFLLRHISASRPRK